MIDFLRSKTDDWGQLGDYLLDEQARLISDAHRHELRAEWDEIARLEQSLDDALLIGLVGGTGVGKSTFINALAGEVISRSGDRRPTTDRVVVYRHVDTELPDDLPQDDFAQPLVLHRHDSLTKVVLFDFPDFDSAERQHADILQRYLDHLDVLLIVVDDVKYADRRLYELLTSLDQAAENLFVLLNKIDRLEHRYEAATHKVIAELLADLREKMQDNAGLNLDSRQLFPISAEQVLTARLENKPTDLIRQFELVEALLQDFQEEKHRRRVKEQNIHTRKQQLVAELSSTALGEENRSILSETRRLVRVWQGELNSALLAIPSELLIDRERRGLRKSRTRRAGRQWGLPFSLVFTLLGEMPWSKSAESILAQHELGARIYQHYRGFFEAIRNLQSRFHSEFTGSKIAEVNLVDGAALASLANQSPETWSTAMAGKALAEIQQHEPHVSAWTRRLWHLPAIGTLLMAIWSRVDPLIDSVSGEGGNFFVALAKSFFATLNPMFIFGVLFAVLLAYVLTSLVLWIREVQTLDGHIAVAEKLIRDDVQQKGNTVVDALENNIQSLGEEFSALEKILGSNLVEATG